MSGEQLEVCPLGYDCSDPKLCSRYSIGVPGVHVEVVQDMGLTPEHEVFHGEDITFIQVCEGPASKGLSTKASELQDFITRSDDGEPFDLVANAKTNASLIDYINHREATDALSRAVRERRREK